MMLKDLFLRQRKQSNRARRGRSLSLEHLENRTVPTATPLGDVLVLTQSATLDRTGDAFSHNVAVSASGQGIVAFQGSRISGDGFSANLHEVLARRIDSTGSNLGELITLNEQTRGNQYRPQVASHPDGGFVAVWHGRGRGDLHGVFARKFDSSGNPQGSTVRVNPEASGRQEFASLALAPTGAGVVVWQGAGTGDSDGIFARRITTSGEPTGPEILVNTTTSGPQSHPSVVMDAEGKFVVTWSSRADDDSDWDIFMRRFDANGQPLGTETKVNAHGAGSQIRPAIGQASNGEFVIAWDSFGQDGDSWGIFAQRFDNAGARLGGEFRLNSTTAGQQRDVSLSVAGSGEFLASWTHRNGSGPGSEVRAMVFNADGSADGDEFVVSRNGPGAPTGQDQRPSIGMDMDGTSFIAYQSSAAARTSQRLVAQRFGIEVTPTQNLPPRMTSIGNQRIRVGQTLELVANASDPNRRDVLQFQLDPDQSPPSATITKIDNNSARIRWTPTASDRNRTVGFRVFVDDNGTPPLGDAVVFVVTVENAPPVVDANGPNVPGINSQVTLEVGQTEVALTGTELTVRDPDQTSVESATVIIRGILDGEAEGLLANVNGTAISQTYVPATGTLQLTGRDTVANYEQVLRTLRYRNTTSNPTPAQRRIEITVQDDVARSEPAEILVNVRGQNTPPTLPLIADTVLLGGSPLHIPLNGKDADGDNLTYTVTSSNPALVQPTVITGNRSLRLSVEEFGEMVFHLFEDRAPRATNQIITLAQEGFYDGIIFHRVVNNFVIQAGDPTGTGTSGSQRPNFDDQFHVDLQHNRTGVLSMAKTTDDTNNSQFFITEGPARHLDFNHTIFGQLVEGESVREAISNVRVNAQSKPLADVTIEEARVFTDTQNGLVMLKAPEGAMGTARITVTVTDARGANATREFNVTVQPDTINGGPFLADIPTIRTRVGVPTQFQLVGRDVENDPVFYLDEAALRARGLFVPAAAPAGLRYSVDPNTGLVRVNPDAGLTGTFRITVAAAASLDGLSDGGHIDYQQVQVVITTNPIVDPA